jgi:hypothetical protein
MIFLNNQILFQLSELKKSSKMYFFIHYLQFIELKVWAKNIVRVWQDLQ